MMRVKSWRAGVGALALAVLLSAGSLASAQYGTVKGKVEYDGTPPDNPEVTVTADKNVCLSKGPVYRDEWVVDKKTKGVRWALVWLTDVSNANARSTEWKGKIHPSLAKPAAKLELDQPVCTFVPRMVAMREGTQLVYKNSAPVPHNVKIDGGAVGPNINQLIPAGKELEVKGVTARNIPFAYTCTIHPWMKGWVGVFKHPYFAVTNEKGEFEIKNAPAGKFRLVVWHEGAGFYQPKGPMNRGVVIEVKDKGTTDVGAIKIKSTD